VFPAPKPKLVAGIDSEYSSKGCIPKSGARKNFVIKQIGNSWQNNLSTQVFSGIHRGSGDFRASI